MKKKNSKAELFGNRRKRLRAEIEAAEYLLKNNMDDLNVLNYVLPATSKLLPTVDHAVKNNPTRLLAPLVLILEKILPEEHSFRRLLTTLNSLAFLFK